MAHLPYPSGPRTSRHRRRSTRSRLTLGGSVAAVAVAIGVITACGGADTTKADSKAGQPTSGVTIGTADRAEAN
ncbi:hypothetical protein OG785_41990 [Streptomyces sp. NBC_00006]|uniref:hypothetical protein n=1 Tax=unclassified Streptomyces TaxID=2593676 RepID=UPI002255F74D|nr:MULTISPECIES: hypothetical protein [unclassified Streptomyces]MCX4835675.1 hypothetical protein [Streptomyces sp. NBC_01016]MCX5537124.1 hypothetical protein [Streptomyces sp. NBC_00006]